MTTVKTEGRLKGKGERMFYDLRFMFYGKVKGGKQVSGFKFQEKSLKSFVRMNSGLRGDGEA